MRRTGVRLAPGDPSFAIVELNKLAFESLIEAAGVRLDPLAERIDRAARKAAADVTRSGLMAISVDTRESRATIAADVHHAREQLALEADAARKSAAAAVERLALAERSAGRFKYLALGGTIVAIVAVSSFALGYALGSPQPAATAVLRHG